LTLEQLAEKSGVNKDTISRIENGRKAFPVTIGKLAVALGIEVEELSSLATENTKKESHQPNLNSLVA
jgi:transcriptional regulator with XRE-family HTH domain